MGSSRRPLRPDRVRGIAVGRLVAAGRLLVAKALAGASGTPRKKAIANAESRRDRVSGGPLASSTSALAGAADISAPCRILSECRTSTRHPPLAP